MGAFASMAQNGYGMKIIGLATISFCVVFLIQFVSMLIRGEQHTAQLLETACLFVLAAIMAMRVFYIRFDFVEYVFALAGVVLALVYIQKMLNVYASVRSESKSLSIMVLIFYVSVVLYLLSMITVPFLPSVSEPAGIAAFVFMILSAIGNLLVGNISVSSQKTTPFQFALRLRDRSMVLLTLFLLFTCYMAFTKMGVVPKLYSNEFPQSYYQLVNQAETGKEIPVKGKFKHETFKENFERFLRHNPVEE